MMLQWDSVNSVGTVPVNTSFAAVCAHSGGGFVFGGKTLHTSKNALYSFRFLAPGEVSWNSVAFDGIPPTPRYGHSLDLVDGKLLVFGGQNSRGILEHDAAVFDIHRQCWFQLPAYPDRPTRRMHHASCVADGRVWINGGLGDVSARLSDLWSIDPREGRWAAWHPTACERPGARAGHAMAHRDGCLYVCGGLSGRAASDAMCAFDLRTDTRFVAPYSYLFSGADRWRVLSCPDPVVSRWHFVSVVRQCGNWLVVGGTGTHTLNNAHSFDFGVLSHVPAVLTRDSETETWTSLSCRGSPHSASIGACGVEHRDVVFVFGGEMTESANGVSSLSEADSKHPRSLLLATRDSVTAKQASERSGRSTEAASQAGSEGSAVRDGHFVRVLSGRAYAEFDRPTFDRYCQVLSSDASVPAEVQIVSNGSYMLVILPPHLFVALDSISAVLAGDLPARLDSPAECLEAAFLLRCEELRILAEDWLCRSLDVRDCLSCLLLAEKFGAERLMTIAVDVAREHFAYVSKLENWKNVPRNLQLKIKGPPKR